MAQREIQVPLTDMGTPEHAARLTEGRDPEIQSALQWLTFSHLPVGLRRFSRPFYLAGWDMLAAVEQDVPELKAALNKLIEAKDAGVRAGIHFQQGRAGSVPRPQEVVDPPTLPQVGKVSDLVRGPEA